MLNSTRLKIKTEQDRNELYEQEIECLKEKNEIEREHYQNEKETKDRADISMKEYKELLKKVEDLTHEKNMYHDALMQFFKPILNNKQISDEVIEKIKTNKFKAEVSFFTNAWEMKDYIRYTIILNQFEEH